jgi:chromate transporter
VAEPNGWERHLREVVAVMLKLGAIAFGGPAVHVAMLPEEAIPRRRGLDDREFLDLFGAVSVLPAPSSTQLGNVLSRRRAVWLGNQTTRSMPRRFQDDELPLHP